MLHTFENPWCLSHRAVLGDSGLPFAATLYPTGLDGNISSYARSRFEKEFSKSKGRVIYIYSGDALHAYRRACPAADLPMSISATATSTRPSAAKFALFKGNIDRAKTNLRPEQLDKIAYVLAWHVCEDSFGESVMEKMQLTECCTFMRPEDEKTHSRVVFEGTVTKDMCNAHHMMHGGCAAFLLDCCPSIAMVVMGLATAGPVDLVSQSLNTTYHAGAQLGDKIQIVNITTASGKRVVTSRAEIWDLTSKRLVVTGHQVKMVPSKSDFKL